MADRFASIRDPFGVRWSVMTRRMVPEWARMTTLSVRRNGPRRCTPSRKSAEVIPVATK